jgi:hypothetical protein
LIDSETQFNLFLLSFSSSRTAIALILLACRTQDSIIFRNTSAYFTKDFGSEFYIRLIMDDVVPLLTIDEKKWMWNLINNP